jgi:hypothetical protein
MQLVVNLCLLLLHGTHAFIRTPKRAASLHQWRTFSVSTSLSQDIDKTDDDTVVLLRRLGGYERYLPKTAD